MKRIVLLSILTLVLLTGTFASTQPVKPSIKTPPTIEESIDAYWGFAVACNHSTTNAEKDLLWQNIKLVKSPADFTDVDLQSSIESYLTAKLAPLGYSIVCVGVALQCFNQFINCVKGHVASGGTTFPEWCITNLNTCFLHNCVNPTLEQH